MPTDAPRYLRLLPEEVVARLKRLELRARGRMQGTITGRHTSPAKGASTDFAEHRPYAPGDDPRRLDWRAFARRDRHLVREYIEETNLRAHLLLDTSASMAYAGELAPPLADEDGPASKFDYARCLAAVLANFLIAQGDATGLHAIGTRVHTTLKPSLRRSNFHRLLATLDAMEPEGESGLGDGLHEIAGRIPRRGLVLLISDLFDDPPTLLSKVNGLLHRGHEVAVFHILAEEELSFPFKGVTRFRDLEAPEDLRGIDPEALRARYLENFNAFLEEIGTGLGRIGAHYIPLNTSEPFDIPVATWLARRGR